MYKCDRAGHDVIRLMTHEPPMPAPSPVPNSSFVTQAVAPIADILRVLAHVAGGDCICR